MKQTESLSGLPPQNNRLNAIIKGLCNAFQHCNDAEILKGMPLSASSEQPKNGGTVSGTNLEHIDKKEFFHMRDFVYLLRHLRREQGAGMKNEK